jgi:hypothetical protein
LKKITRINKQRSQQWIRTKYFYCLNKAWCKLSIRWFLNTKGTTCVHKIERWCYLYLLWYYHMEPSKKSLTFLKVFHLSLLEVYIEQHFKNLCQIIFSISFHLTMTFIVLADYFFQFTFLKFMSISFLEIFLL